MEHSNNNLQNRLIYAFFELYIIEGGRGANISNILKNSIKKACATNIGTIKEITEKLKILKMKVDNDNVVFISRNKIKAMLGIVDSQFKISGGRSCGFNEESLFSYIDDDFYYETVEFKEIIDECGLRYTNSIASNNLEIQNLQGDEMIMPNQGMIQENITENIDPERTITIPNNTNNVNSPFRFDEIPSDFLRDELNLLNYETPPRRTTQRNQRPQRSNENRNNLNLTGRRLDFGSSINYNEVTNFCDRIINSPLIVRPNNNNVTFEIINESDSVYEEADFSCDFETAQLKKFFAKEKKIKCKSFRCPVCVRDIPIDLNVSACANALIHTGRDGCNQVMVCGDCTPRASFFQKCLLCNREPFAFSNMDGLLLYIQAEYKPKIYDNWPVYGDIERISKFLKTHADFGDKKVFKSKMIEHDNINEVQILISSYDDEEEKNNNTSTYRRSLLRQIFNIAKQKGVSYFETVNCMKCKKDYPYINELNEITGGYYCIRALCCSFLCEDCIDSESFNNSNFRDLSRIERVICTKCLSGYLLKYSSLNQNEKRQVRTRMMDWRSSLQAKGFILNENFIGRKRR